MEHVLTEEQQTTIDKGVAAAQLLQNPAFTSTFNDLAASFTNGITSSEPKEQRKREDFYFMHVALQSVIGLLRARVAAAMELEEALAADVNEANLNTPDAPLMADAGL